MAQGVLPFKYEEEKNETGMTALAGLPTYLDLSKVIGLHKAVDNHVRVRTETQGWTDAQVVSALILLNLAGGDCVEDLRVLEGDEGFCRVLQRVAQHGLRRTERRKLERRRRWRKEKKRAVPSPSAAFRYLSGFHDGDQETKRRAGKAFIPQANEHLQGLCRVNRELVSFVQSNKPSSVATLDMDATVVETNKKEALYCYKGFKSYQPLNTWWAEQEVVVHTEFRDGNVPAGYEQLRVLKEALECLPSGAFGENAAWWWIMILALNLNATMKNVVLGGAWVNKRMKAIRFSLINLPGRILERARSMIIRLPKDHPKLDLLIEARRKIAELLPAPG